MRFLSILTCSLLLIGDLVAQQNVNLNGSEWLSQITPLPKAPFKTNRGIVATYDLTWKGKIRAGNATVVLSPTAQPLINASIKGRSTGIAGKLFPYEFDYSAKFSKGDLITPISSSFKDNKRKEKSQTNTTFQNSMTICHRTATDKKTSTTQKKHKNFLLTDNVSQCAFSALINSREQPLTKGQEITALIIPVDRPYLLKFTVLGREQRKVKGKKYNTIKMDLKILGKVNSDKSLKTYDKVKNCTIWLNDDADRLPLELQAELFVGSMVVYQTSLKYTN